MTTALFTATSVSRFAADGHCAALLARQLGVTQLRIAADPPTPMVAPAVKFAFHEFNAGVLLMTAVKNVAKLVVFIKTLGAVRFRLVRQRCGEMSKNMRHWSGLLVLCSACAAVQSNTNNDEVEQRLTNVCAAAAQQVRMLLKDPAVSACTRNEDCVNLSPTITGRCNVFVSQAGFTANHDAFHTSEAACDELPQVAPVCTKQVGVCASGQCSGESPVFVESECEQATASAKALLSAPASCNADSECTMKSLANQAYPTLAHSPERDAAIAQRESLCGRSSPTLSTLGDGFAAFAQGSVCTNHVCSTADEAHAAMTRPTVPMACLQPAITPIVRGATRRTMMIVKADISANGVANHFQFIQPMLKDESKAMLARAFHRCQWRPATYLGAPISVSYVLNFDIRPEPPPAPRAILPR